MKYTSILLVALFTFCACKRNVDKSKLGPEVIIVPENFTISGFTVMPTNNANLAMSNPYLKSDFPQKAEYKITYRGILSGAETVITGTGEYLDSLNSAWTGESDNIYMFKKNEKCEVKLSFRGATTEYIDTINIVSENKYDYITLVNDFEGYSINKNGPNGTYYGNYFDGTDIKNADINTDNISYAPQGYQTLNMEGYDSNNSFYIGGFYFYPSTTYYTFKGNNLDSLYVNAYVYSYYDNSAILSVSFTDADGDEFTLKDISFTGTGWGLMNLPLKKFTDNNKNVGNGVINQDKIIGFNLNFNAKTAGSYAHALIDYVNVSYGKPFNP
ncbi:MAG: hypothetical protein U0V72_15935 [Cytophagales bacterium]